MIRASTISPDLDNPLHSRRTSTAGTFQTAMEVTGTRYIGEEDEEARRVQSISPQQMGGGPEYMDDPSTSPSRRHAWFRASASGAGAAPGPMTAPAADPTDMPVIDVFRVSTTTDQGPMSEIGSPPLQESPGTAAAAAETSVVASTVVMEAHGETPIGEIAADTSAAPAAEASVATRLGRRLIVLGMDDSNASQVCLSWALRQLIHPERDHLVVLHVAPFKVAGLLGRNEEKTAKREIKAEGRAQRILDYAAAHVGQFVSELHVPLSFELVSLKAANQDVRDVVLDYVHDVSATMLLLGSHSGGSLKRAVLGSTATYCLNHAAIPVIIVNEQGGVKAG